MLNLSVFPDLLAIGGLVLVFAALLRRTRQTRLRYWLVGWVMILIHIVAQLLYLNVKPLTEIGEAVSLGMLLLTSVSFIWAGQERRSGWVHGFAWTLLAALPDVTFAGLLAWDIEDRQVFLWLTCLAAAAALSLFYVDRRGARSNERRLFVVAVLSAYAVQAVLVMRAGLDLAMIWMLFWHYAAVAWFFWRSSRRATAGVVLTTASFAAWAMVFPLGYVLDRWLPGLQIENEAWNLPKFMVATGMIFTLLEEQLLVAKHAATHDALTGLPNRRLFTQRLDDALARARRESGRLALLVIDMDDFKQVNDTRGHAIGDALLATTASRLQSRLRMSDTLARLGGDEFAAILGGPVDEQAVSAQIERLLGALRAGVEVEGETIVVQASVGVAFYPEDGSDEASLLVAADRAMYVRKFIRRESRLA